MVCAVGGDWLSGPDLKKRSDHQRKDNGSSILTVAAVDSVLKRIQWPLIQNHRVMDKVVF